MRNINTLLAVFAMFKFSGTFGIAIVGCVGLIVSPVCVEASQNLAKHELSEKPYKEISFKPDQLLLLNRDLSKKERNAPVLIAQSSRIPIYYGMSDWGKPVYIAIANGIVYAWTGDTWSDTGVTAYGSVFNNMMRRFRFVGYMK